MKKYKNKKSKYYNKTVDDILQSWEDNKNIACEEGTKLHESIELYYNKIPTDYTSKEYGFFENFIKDHQHLEAYRTEWEIYYEEKQIAGSIDMIFRNPDGSFSIYDWKRCRKMEKSNNFEFGLDELDHLPNTNFWHYSLQLNIYQYILELKYNIHIKDLFLVVMHPDNKNYMKYQCPNLQTEVKVLLC